jgi:hypothetical protein
VGLDSACHYELDDTKELVLIMLSLQGQKKKCPKSVDARGAYKVFRIYNQWMVSNCRRLV